MLKDKKRKEYKGKKLEETGKKTLTEENAVSQENNLSEQIKNAVKGLYYVSETDAVIQPFVGKQSESVTKESVLSQTENAADSPVEEKDFTMFFARLTEIQDWFGDEETETAKKFVQLKELLEKNLRELKVFKIGKVQLDVYIVGLDSEDNLLGIKTEAIET